MSRRFAEVSFAGEDRVPPIATRVNFGSGLPLTKSTCAAPDGLTSSVPPTSNSRGGTLHHRSPPYLAPAQRLQGLCPSHPCINSRHFVESTPRDRDMAHPLTQHPPNMIGFGAPATMSPLGFGFGQPGMALGSPVRPGAFNSLHHGLGSMSPGFASPSFASAGPSSPLKRASPPRTVSSAVPTTSHKRTRRASSVSSSSSPLGSPSFGSRRLDDDDRRERKIAGSKATKRIRKETETVATTSDGPDLGVLLGQ